MRQQEERLMKMAATENRDSVFFIMFSLQIGLKVACYSGEVLEFWSGACNVMGLYQHTFSKHF